MNLFKPTPSPTEEETPSPSLNAGDASSDSEPDWGGVHADLQDDHGDDPALEVDGSPPDVDQAEQDQVRRDMFFSAVSGAFKGANWLRVRQGQAALRSLELETYDELARQASDQLHDRLMEIPWVARVFGPVNQFAARYGAIFAFGVVIQASVRAELKELAANDDDDTDEAPELETREPEAA